MSWADALQNINYLGVVLGVLASMIIGMVWYNPKVWGEQWIKLVGFKKKDLTDKQGMPVMMTISVVFYFLVAITVAALLEMTSASGTGVVVLLGAINSLKALERRVFPVPLKA